MSEVSTPESSGEQNFESLILKLMTQNAELMTKLTNQHSSPTTTQPRTIPLVDKLVKQEDFLTWRKMVIRALNRFDLAKYILSDIPEPVDPAEAKQWRLDRADVEEYLHAVVPGHKTWSNLEGLGWNVEDMDPKKTWDKLAQYFEKGSATSNFDMFNELTTIRCDSFDKVEAYQQRLNYLRQRLAGTPFKQTNEVYTWCALQGIAKEYPELYSRSLTNIQNNKLT